MLPQLRPQPGCCVLLLSNPPANLLLFLQAATHRRSLRNGTERAVVQESLSEHVVGGCGAPFPAGPASSELALVVLAQGRM